MHTTHKVPTKNRTVAHQPPTKRIAPQIAKGVNTPKKADTLAASAMRQARRGLGVFGVALALSGVVVAMMAAPDAGTKKRAARVLWERLVRARRRS